MLMYALITSGIVIVASWGGHFLVVWLLILTGHKSTKTDAIAVWIGIFERALVSLFVCLGFVSQTVFIFAVKAAVLSFRLPDDKDHKKSTAEYMLLGTMISYFVALCISLLGFQIMKIFS